MRAHPGHTLALARRLRELGGLRPIRRIGRVPRQLPPTAIVRSYHDAISQLVVEAARDAFHEEAPAILRLLTEHRRELGHEDAAPRIDAGKESDADKRRARQRAGEVGRELKRASRQGKRAAQLIDIVARGFARKFHPSALHDLVQKFGKRTSEHSQRELDKQVRAAIGVPLSAVEKPVRDHIESWAAENIDLIKTISDRYFDRLRLDVEEAFASGTHPKTLAATFEERYGMANRDAMRIARDQIGKLNGQVNQARQEALGVTHYIWRTMRDNRVRNEHHRLEGKRFAYDKPPPAGPNGTPANPGEAIQCRCYAEPDFSSLLAAV